MDRLSLLPDRLLHEILSFVDTKSVVQTCVLSKRWKTLWLETPNLNFNFHSQESSPKNLVLSFLAEHRSKFIKNLNFSSSIDTLETRFVLDILLLYAQPLSVRHIRLNTFNTVLMVDLSRIDEVNITLDYDDDDHDDVDSAIQKLKDTIYLLLDLYHTAASFTLPFKAMEMILSDPFPFNKINFGKLRCLKLKTEAANHITNLSIATLRNSFNFPNLEKLEIEV